MIFVQILQKPAIRRLIFSTVIACCLLIAACEKPDSISISGSTTVLPVVSMAAESFTSLQEIPIIVNAGGSGVGINQLGSGKIAIGMISRELTAAEISQYPGVHFVTHKIGRDAVVPVVSSEIYAAGVRALSIQQIGKIYRGEIDNWQQVGGPDLEILVVDKEKSRGTRHVFMEVVLGDKHADAAGADLVLGDNKENRGQTTVIPAMNAL